MEKWEAFVGSVCIVIPVSRAQNVADALRDADGAPREGKPLLDLSSWAAD
jgi:hypothetical protein